MMDLFLGLDLGTSSVKAVVIDAEATVLASGHAAYPTIADAPGQAEQDPALWMQAAAAAVGEVAAMIGAEAVAAIAAIGLTGQLPTLVCLGKAGPLGPAIAWTDSRADAWATAHLDDETRETLYRATGMPIDGRYLAPMFRFHWWDRRNAVRRILSAKDYLCFALTGRAITDPSTAAGYATFDLHSTHWNADLCAVWDLDPGLLPDIGPAGAIAGPLLDAAACLLGLRPGIPVTVGAADSVAGALAMVGTAENCASIVMGSSSIIIAATDRLHFDSRGRYLLTPHAVPGLYGREMDLLSTGTGLQWLGALFGLSTEALEEQALLAPAGAKGVTCAPYFAGGEQGALWDPSLGGVLHGLGLGHSRADIARAYFEGVFFEMRRCLDVLEETTRIDRVVLSGHATGNPGLVAMAADALGRPVTCFTQASPSAIGAAMLAGEIGTPPRHSQDETRPGAGSATYEPLYRRHLSLFPRIATPSPDLG